MQKIYRIEKEQMVAGICAGLAHMFNIDLTIMRLIVVFVTVISGIWPGILTYLAGWYLIPTIEKVEPRSRKNNPKTP